MARRIRAERSKLFRLMESCKWLVALVFLVLSSSRTSRLEEEEEEDYDEDEISPYFLYH
jgi:hypothetical protein